jgi:hypothetical protein
LSKKNNNRKNKSEIRLHHNTLYIHTNIPYLYITFCRIKTEQDLKNKLSNIVEWTNVQRESEQGEIRIHQGIIDGKNKQL